MEGSHRWNELASKAFSSVICRKPTLPQLHGTLIGRYFVAAVACFRRASRRSACKPDLAIDLIKVMDPSEAAAIVKAGWWIIALHRDGRSGGLGYGAAIV